MGRPKKQPTMEENGCVIHAGFRIRRRVIGDGTSHYVAELGLHNGKRLRKQFATLAAARNYCDRHAVERERVGLAARALSDAHRLDAVSALRLLEGLGATLTDAAREYRAAHAPPDADGITFEALAGDFVDWLETTPRKLNTKSPGGYRPATVADVAAKLRRCSRDLGATPAAAVTSDVLRAWLDAQDFHPTPWDNHRRAVSMLFRWATGPGQPLEKGTNPAAGLEPPALESSLPAIWPPETVAAVMGYVAEHRPPLVAYVACGFFAGLRPDECRRITPDALDFEHGEIRVPAAAAKTHAERLVTMSANLRAWLVRYPPDGAKPLGPSYASLARFRREIRQALKLSAWPKDVARHCFGTYHAALYGMDETAVQLGHGSTAMLNRHYRGLVASRRPAAERYFAITPAAAAAAGKGNNA